MNIEIFDRLYLITTLFKKKFNVSKIRSLKRVETF